MDENLVALLVFSVIGSFGVGFVLGIAIVKGAALFLERGH